MTLTRRAVTLSLTASLTALSLPLKAAALTIPATGEAIDPTVKRPGQFELKAGKGLQRLSPEPAGETELLTLNGSAPGPVLRLKLGEELRLKLVNDFDRPLSFHLHGMRGPNMFDGVAGLTQKPLEPGASTDIRFTPPDAGLFLLRPLVLGQSGELAARGLSSLLIVDEAAPPPVDHDFALIVQDWRLDEKGAPAPFGDPLEAATGGRLGGLVTVDGHPVPHAIEVAPGARIRLRLANASNARAMRIRFDDLKAYTAAIDSQPTDNFEPLRSTLPLAPGTRYELFLEMPDEPGKTGHVAALIGQGLNLVSFTTKGDKASRPALPPLKALAENKRLPEEIRLQNAARKDLLIEGGARRGEDGQLVFEGDPKKIWTINGAVGDAGKPLLTVPRGSPVVLALANSTPVTQAFHLHGHVFRLLHGVDDGWDPYWLDTLQIPSGRTIRIAFVADNPGKWLIGSTVLERLDAGLWTWLEVKE